MLREKVAKLTKFLFAGATMALCVATVNPAVQVQAGMLEESEPNEVPANATSLPLNTWMRGITVKGSDTDYYSFIIPEGNGCAQVELRSGDDNPKDSAKWRVDLYDADRNPLNNFSGNSGKSYVLGLAPGKYLVKVKSTTGYGPQCSYNLRVNYTASSQWEKEQYYKNKTMGNANPVVVNKLYTGNLYRNFDKDYYRIKLNGTNNVTFKFMIDDSVDVPGRWRVDFYDAKTFKRLKANKNNSISANETWTVRCTGDLIVKIGTSSNAEGKIYHIQAFAKTYKAPVVKPAATTISSIKAGKRQATVYWRKANNATGYYVYRSTNSKSGYKKIATVTGKTYYTDKKSLTSKKTYYYKVVSIRKSGSKVLTAKSSACKSVKIK